MSSRTGLSLLSDSKTWRMANEEEDSRERKPMRLHTKIILSSGHFLNAVCWAVWFPYNLLFFTKVLQLNPHTAGDIIISAQVVGAFSMPFVGVWSDQTQLKKFGRRKIFHLLGMVATAISFFFIWYECITCTHAPDEYQGLYFGSFAVVFLFGWSAIVVSQLSLIPELAPDKPCIVQLNSLRNMFTYLGSILVFSVILILLLKYNDGSSTLTQEDKKIFWPLALFVLVVGLLSVAPFQIFIRENPSVKLPTLQWHKWVRKPEFYLTGILYFSTRMVYLVPQTFMSFYFLDHLHMDKLSVAKGPLILLITSFLATFAVKPINRLLREKMTLFLGFAVIWGAVVWFWVQEPTTDNKSSINIERDSIYGAIILLGAGGAVVLAVAMAMFSFLIGDFIGSSAFVIGWMNFADLFFNGIVVKIIQSLTPQKEQLHKYYRNVMVYVPLTATGIGISAICGFLLLEWIQRLKTKRTTRSRTRGASILRIQSFENDERGFVMSDTLEFEPSSTNRKQEK